MKSTRKFFILSTFFAVIYFVLLIMQVVSNNSKGSIILSYTLELSFCLLVICTIITAILKYKDQPQKGIIIFMNGCIAWYIGQIFLNAYIRGYIGYSVFKVSNVLYVVSFGLFIWSLISSIKSKKYIRIIINSIVEITTTALNIAFLLWYLICQYIIYTGKQLDRYRLDEVKYVYPIFNAFMVLCIYCLIERFFSGDYSRNINNYRRFLSKKTWYGFITSVLAVLIVIVFDHWMDPVLRYSRVLQAILVIIAFCVVIREGFNFWGYRSIVDDFEERIKYTDILLDYNVNISRDLKKSLEKSKQEIELAKKIQQALIPDKATILADTFTINSKLITSMDMCGDYYDYFSNGDVVIWVVADVMGKGMKAAMLGSNLRTSLKMLLEKPQNKEELDPGNLLEKVNMFMFDDLDKIGAYITMVVGIFDIKQNVFKVSSAGHVPPIYISDGKVDTISIKATAIGLKRASAYTTKTIKLNSGDSVIFYTDGAWDVRDVKSNRLGSKEFLNYIENNKEKSFDLLNLIEKKLNEYKGRNEFSDDITISVLNMV